jgi:hypothetical protein
MRSHNDYRKRAIVWHLRALPLVCMMLPLLLLFSACGFTLDRNVRAFNACLTRHPEDAPLCEAPRQAYEIDFPTVAASSAPGIRQ